MPAAALSLDHLRRYAVARTLLTPTTLPSAIRRLVQERIDHCVAVTLGIG